MRGATPPPQPHTRFPIPDEIIDFFNVDGNTALVVKGEPGTGKTIFSLQYIASQIRKKRGIYFSTRVNINSLYSQFPWIKGSIPPENIIDATQNVLPERMRIPQLIRFSSLPEFLKGLYMIVEQTPHQEVNIVVDSIDAIASSVGLLIEDVATKLINAIQEMNVKALIITERTEKSILDYICDGVIVLKKKIIDERIFRELVIEKLRGVEIKNAIYYFTLHEGRFKHFKEFSPLKISKRHYEPHPVIKDGEGTKFFEKHMFSTGNQQLDSLLGGFKRGSFVLIEVSEDVPFDFVINITAPVIENFILQDRGVIMVPPGDINPSYLINIYSSTISRDNLKKSYRTITTCPLAVLTSHPYFCENIEKCSKNIISNKDIHIESLPCLNTMETPLKSLFKVINRVIGDFRKNLNKEYLLFVSFERLEADLGPETAEKAAMELIARVRSEDCLCVGITFPAIKINPKLKYTADYFFKVFSREDVLFIYSIHPASKIYNVNIDYSQPHPRLYLTPIT